MFRRRHDEDDAWRRLFESFQECVRGFVREHVRFIDDVDRARRNCVEAARLALRDPECPDREALESALRYG